MSEITGRIDLPSYFQGQMPTSEGAVKEAEKIIRDSSHAMHHKFHAGDAEAKALVDALFDLKYPGEEVIGGGQLEQQMAAAARDFDAQSHEDPIAARAASEGVLRSDWADRYDDNIAVVHGFALKHIPMEQGQALYERYPGLFDDPDIIKLIHRFATQK